MFYDVGFDYHHPTNPDGIYLQHPCPVHVGGQWRLYYNGWTLNPKVKNAMGAEYAIGLAQLIR